MSYPADDPKLDFGVNGGCPDCGCLNFLHGPRGGASRNYGCVACGAWFNLCIFDGDIVFAHRIDGERRHDNDLERAPLPVHRPN